MPINLPTSVISGAVPYSGSELSSIPLRLCNPPPDKLKCVPIEITLTTLNSVYVDLSNGNPPILSQACSMYVDATNCDFDILILFADSGYERTTQAKNTQWFSIVTGVAAPKFYVQSVGGFTPGNKVKIFVFNQFIPEDNTQNFQKSQLYATSYNAIGLEEIPMQVAMETRVIPISTTLFTILSTTANGISIAGMQFYFDCQSSVDEYKIITLYQNAAAIWQRPVKVTTTRDIISLCEMGFINNGRRANSFTTHGILQIAIDSTTNLTVNNIYCNTQYTQQTSI